MVGAADKGGGAVPERRRIGGRARGAGAGPARDVERLRHTVCTMLVCTGHGHGARRPPPCGGPPARDPASRDRMPRCQSVNLSVSLSVCQFPLSNMVPGRGCRASIY